MEGAPRIHEVAGEIPAKIWMWEPVRLLLETMGGNHICVGGFGMDKSGGWNNVSGKKLPCDFFFC